MTPPNSDTGGGGCTPSFGVDSAASSDVDDGGVIIGPDLNPTRSSLDKKVYRQIILKKNGLRAVLISDTVAMGQKDELDTFGGDESGYDSEASSVIGDSGSCDDDKEEGGLEEKEEDEVFDVDEDENYENDDGHGAGEGVRHAAAALAVGAGSYYDPLCVQGIAHFLEHMLFMGTEKYPTENAYDSFLSRVGGSNNAYTEMEHTMYHFEVPQEKMFESLDMFAQFFVSPLLLEEAAGRELNAIESEFQLSKNADGCRLQQLLCHTGKSKEDHPFGKFSWGNIQSLKEIPEKNGVDVMAELRKFYDEHYYASNMRLVVIGAYTVEELQEHVVRCFSEVPPLPRKSSPLDMIRENVGTWDEICRSPIADVGAPFPPESLGRIYLILPVKDQHTLNITWQIPSQRGNWRSKPSDYIAHLLGHEASGSLLSALKEKSWATACYAGVGTGGYENSSSHALFTLSFTLSEEGVSKWAEIVAEVYKYVGMLRYHCNSREGLPIWIHEELRAIQQVAYKYEDEKMPDVLVEDVAEEMMSGLPPERILDGNALLFEYDEGAIKDILDNFLTPSNSRIDVMSSAFGRESDRDDSLSCPFGTCENMEILSPDKQSIQKEPMFEARYWVRILSDNILSDWTEYASPQLPPSSSILSLPPMNPFVPTKFDLKPLPPGDGYHPLLHCKLKVYASFGNKPKSWYPAKATKFNKTKNSILLSYPDRSEKWHVLDNGHGEALAEVGPATEGSFDSETVKFKVVTKSDQEDVIISGNINDKHHFPQIPLPSPASHLPKMISHEKNVKLWHMQDRKFKRPIAEFRLRFICAEANKTPLHRACADLFAVLCRDAATETLYLADVCELGCSISATDAGFTIRLNGFDHKLLNLASYFLELVFSFRDENSGRLPPSIKEGRFEACLEVLLRQYGNAGMRASGFATDMRLMSIMPAISPASLKAKSLNGIAIPAFMQMVGVLLKSVSVEALFAGNVAESDANDAADLLKETLSQTDSNDLLCPEQPQRRVLKVPSGTEEVLVVVPTRDPNESNTAVEAYYQFGWDNLNSRVLIDLLANIMYEPLFNQLRTKEQIGYDVSVGARWTHGCMGMSFKVTTSTQSAEEVSNRLDRFLEEFRLDLITMENEVFLEHVIGLMKNKLHMYNSLEEECGTLWGEICEGRYDWEYHRDEAAHLREVTKEELIAAFDEWLSPLDENGEPRKRRRLVINVIGSGDGASSSGRPEFGSDVMETEIENRIKAFHEAARGDFWEAKTTARMS